MEQSAPSKSATNTIQTVSQKSADRITRLIEGVAGPYCCIHQTFTFPEPVFDLPTGKSRLKKVLDAVHKQFETASIYVFERHLSGAWHVHLLFFFFPMDGAGAAVPKDFTKVVFSAWNKIHDGKCFPGANKSSLVRRVSSDYLLKAVSVVSTTKREDANWWGFRNKRLLSAHRSLPPAKVRRKKWIGQLTPRVTNPWPWGSQPSDADREGISWEVFKRRRMNRTSAVSDKQFLEFLKTIPEPIPF